MGYFNITTVAIFYLNYLWIMPRFWLKGKRLTTLLIWLVALVLIPGIPKLGRVFVLPLIAPEMPRHLSTI